jgi:hypothetical protein
MWGVSYGRRDHPADFAWFVDYQEACDYARTRNGRVFKLREVATYADAKQSG